MSIEFATFQTTSDVVALVASVAVFVASYRRSRCLSRYPVWRSIVIALVTSAFILLWLVVWWVNRRRIADEWRDYRETRTPSPAPAT